MTRSPIHERGLFSSVLTEEKQAIVSRNIPTMETGLHVFADGCCEPNPGSGGWAFAVYRDGREIASDRGGVEHSTNNAMELNSLLRAVDWIASNANGERAIIWSDSAYTVNGCNNWRHIWKHRGWHRKSLAAKSKNRTVANLELWQAIDSALTANSLVSVSWCKGHAGIVGNERADELANIGRLSLSDSFIAVNSGHELDREYRAIMGGFL